MSATTEELYREWRTAYLCRGKAIDLAGGAQMYQEEGKILKTHEYPHFQAQIAVEDKLFTAPADTLQELAVKVLLAFTDTDEPHETHRKSLIADAVRITGLPTSPDATKGATQ